MNGGMTNYVECHKDAHDSACGFCGYCWDGGGACPAHYAARDMLAACQAHAHAETLAGKVGYMAALDRARDLTTIALNRLASVGGK